MSHYQSHIRRTIFSLLIVIIAMHFQSSGLKADAPIRISAKDLQSGLISLSEIDNLWWAYKPGFGSTEFAAPNYNDTEWFILPNEIDSAKWEGIGWFRLYLEVDSVLSGQPLAFVFRHSGAMEVYLDGKLIRKIGEVSDLPESEEPDLSNITPTIISLTGRHVLAVRYSEMNYREFTKSGLAAIRNIKPQAFADVNVTIWPVNATLMEWQRDLVSQVSFSIGRLSLYATLGLLFLLLYLFYPRQNSSLYFSLYAFALAINIAGSISQSLFNLNFYEIEILKIVASLTIGLISISFLLFLYKEFYDHLPKIFWFYPVMLALSALSLIVPWMRWFTLYFAITIIFSAIHCLYILIAAYQKGRRDTWILFVGTVCHSINVSRLGFEYFGISMGQDMADSVRLASTLGVLVAVTIYLARRVARTNTDLEMKLVEVKELSEKSLQQEVEKKLLEAENKRKSDELESARSLQLSMLPKEIPNILGLDIAVFMKTAAEVGGDYYDFQLSEKGVLTVALGDATGHGTKAGMMVTIAKSYFQTLAAEPEPLDILHRMSHGIRTLNLRALYLGLQLLKYDQGKVIMVSAGMPPAMIFRAAERKVEKVIIKSMPLGSVEYFPYPKEVFTLHPGDTLLMMTDGLPELFSPQRELLGYERVEEKFLEVGDQSASMIINHLAAWAESWVEKKSINDDITLVVLKAT